MARPLRGRARALAVARLAPPAPSAVGSLARLVLLSLVSSWWLGRARLSGSAFSFRHPALCLAICGRDIQAIGSCLRCRSSTIAIRFLPLRTAVRLITLRRCCGGEASGPVGAPPACPPASALRASARVRKTPAPSARPLRGARPPPSGAGICLAKPPIF